MTKGILYRRYEPGVTYRGEKNVHGFWLAFNQTSLLLVESNGKLELPILNGLEEVDLTPIRIQYLGTLEGHPCYSAELSPEAKAPQGMSFRDLRMTYSELDEDIFLLAGRALQIIAWDQTHQYCGRCGHKTEDFPGERAKRCPSCGFLSYPRLSPATITAVIKGNKILLSHYARVKTHMHTIIAGFVEPGESLEECVHREILEEAGVYVKNIKYFGSQPWPFPNSLMIGFTAEYESGDIKVDGVEISEAGWYDAANLPEIPPKMSISREIIDWYVQNYSGKV
jgi:NAD+ diphosphatase